jgi:hypothetical protein
MLKSSPQPPLRKTKSLAPKTMSEKHPLTKKTLEPPLRNTGRRLTATTLSRKLR